MNKTKKQKTAPLPDVPLTPAEDLVMSKLIAGLNAAREPLLKAQRLYQSELDGITEYADQVAAFRKIDVESKYLFDLKTKAFRSRAAIQMERAIAAAEK